MKTLCSALLLSAAFAISAASAGDIWHTTALDAQASTICTDGDLVYAWAADKIDKDVTGELVVNGVTFRTVWSLSNHSSGLILPFSMSPQLGYDGTSLGTCGVVDDDYAHLLNNCWWYQSDATINDDITFTLNGLESGNRYLVQLIFHSGSGYSMTTPDGSQTLAFSGNQNSFSCCGTIVGEFDATDSAKQFAIRFASSDGGRKARLCGLQVRKLSGVEPKVVEPSIGSLSKSVSGAGATITLDAVVKGTDDECVDASSYSVWYSLTNAPAVEVLSVQSGGSAAFTITGLADGHYTCEVMISNDVGKVSAAKSVEFDISTGGELVLGWTAEPMSASGDTIRTDGTLLYAYAQYASKTTYTVNTVPFSADDGIYGGNCSVSFNYRTDSTPPTGVSGDYALLLQYGWWGGKGDQTFTFNKLTEGKTYLAQIIMCHTDNWGSSASEAPCNALVTGPEGVQARLHGDGWEYGGSLIGVFAATNTSVSFTVNYANARAYFNAVQVREVENVKPPRAKMGTIIIFR